MAGGPSHLETFDPKPKLAELDGQPMPESHDEGPTARPTAGQEAHVLRAAAPVREIRRESNGNLLRCSRNIGSVIDDICLIRSMTTDAINHDPAHMFMNTGSQIAGRPSMGAWVTYGLGSEGADLPGFVVLVSLGKGGQNQPIAARQWSSGFLPSRYQGVQLRSQGEPVLYLNSPAGISREQQGADIAAINALNRQHERVGRRSGNRHAHRAVRDGVPDAGQRARADGPYPARGAKTLELYGCQPGDGSFASNCLLARRLAERGVRFIQLYHNDWDHHSRRKGRRRSQGSGDRPRLHGSDHRPQATRHARRDADRVGRRVRPHADVARRQRPRPPQQGHVRLARRRRHPAAAWFTAPPTISGYAAVEKVATVHDLHATMLHQLGIEPDAVHRQVPRPRRQAHRRRRRQGDQRDSGLKRREPDSRLLLKCCANNLVGGELVSDFYETCSNFLGP